MAIMEMSSFSLIALKEDKDAILRELQHFGNVHFRTIAPSGDDFLKALPEEDVDSLIKKRDNIRQYIAEIEFYEKANRWLVTAHERKKLFQRNLNVDTMTFEELEQQAQQIDITAILGSMDEAESLHEDQSDSDTLQHIEPWEDQRLKEHVLVEIRDAKPIVGTVVPEAAEAFTQDIRNAQQIYAIVRKEKDGNVLFVLKPSLDQSENAEILAQKHHMKRRSADAVQMKSEVLAFRQKMDKMISRRNRTDGSLEKLAGRKRDLQIYHEYIENLLLRAEESKKFMQTEFTIVIEGWVLASDKQPFQETVERACKNHFVLKFKDVPKSSDAAPVKLKNNRFTSAFESITKMYSTPRYHEIDPTPIFAPFYLLFFGMMLADIGYGLVMMATMFMVLLVFNLKPSIQHFVKFLFFLSFSTVFWGFIYGSFFGGIIPLKPLINANTEYNRVLIMAMLFGILHLLLGLGVKAYICIRDKHPFYALFDVGFWYMVLISAILLVVSNFISGLQAYQTIFLVVMVSGMAGIVLTNGRNAKTILGKFASGLYSLYGLVNYISDIISYSRLMALGLAGGSIGIAINMMVRMIADGNGVIGILFGSIVFMGGHMFNLFISGLSSYVHSSRLIYVEFFSKFYTGGGMSFAPFRAKNTYINVV